VQSYCVLYQAAIKPEAQKPFTEQLGDNIAGKSDKLASHAQPESNKSTTQKIIDSKSPVAIPLSSINSLMIRFSSRYTWQ